ncbi:unnamed protein product [Linum tenue]|uniref:BHLH domain-containing protein n=1 Tax=Linum tenue TaxID=586396 RepID=A0AAV0KZ34_9ROSI|nr:unnamed protein product [Linum tenue]
MQPCSREMAAGGLNSPTTTPPSHQFQLHDLHQIHGHFDHPSSAAAAADFLDQFLSSAASSPWSSAAAAAASPGKAQPQASGSAATASQGKPRVRARRGQATDPHSIAERLRRERIAERMKSLQELVPNANKTDKASMLDEIIDYVKFLQLQVKVLSMSRLGGAGAVAPLVTTTATASEGGGGGGSNNATAAANGGSSANESSMTMTEHQVAKLMEEDMGSAMQYLQGKGLCLMPISLATAISTATCRPGQPSSPNMSVLTGDVAVKDSTSATKP